LDLPLILY
jgi:trans-aconitate methyltransferase